MNDSGFSLVKAWKFCATAACEKLGSVCSSIPKKICRDWKRNAFLFTTCACAAASVLGVGSAWGDYKVIDLDLPSPPLAINNHKQIVGTLTDQGKGYIYNAETGTYTWITGTGLSLKDINDNGEVVGVYGKEHYYQKRVENKYTGTSHLEDAWLVVGTVFVYNNGSFRDLPIVTIPEDYNPSYDRSSYPYLKPTSINNQGDVTGYADTLLGDRFSFINDPNNPVLFARSGSYWQEGESSTFFYPSLLSINDNGIVTGAGRLYSDGKLVKIEVPEGVWLPYDYGVFPVNNQNKMIGTYTVDGDTTPREILYDLDDGTFDIVLKNLTLKYSTPLSDAEVSYDGVKLLDLSNDGRLLLGKYQEKGGKVHYFYAEESPDESSDGAVNTEDAGKTPCEYGNPISIGTGNKFQEETDYQGAAHTGLEMIRYYNSQGNGESGMGRRWTSTWHRLFAYDNSSDAEQVYISRADGKTYHFTKNDSGAWETGPDDLLELIGNNSSGWSLVLPDDSTERYSSEGLLQSITTREGRVTSLAYDGQGNLSTVTGPFGHRLSFSCDGEGYISRATLPDGGVYSYTHDSNGNLVSVTYPDGAKRQYVYENTTYPNALTGIIDANGSRFSTYTYDAEGRAVESTHAGGAEMTSVTYGDDAASVILPSGGQRAISFATVFGQVKPTEVENSSCNCGARAYEYDPNTGLLASRTDNNGNMTSYVRNDRGLEISRTEAVGTEDERTITTEWHASFRLPTKITDGERVTSFSYNQDGTLLRRTVSGGGASHVWTYSYNDDAQLVQIDGPRSDVEDVTNFTYDSYGNLASVRNALGHKTSYDRYDANGNLLQVTDPNGLVTQYEYDERGRLIEKNTGGEVTRYEYDFVGLLSKLTRPDGSYLSYSYDAAHRLTSVSDAQGNSIKYQLDEAGNVLSETVADQTGNLARMVGYSYDDLNRVTTDKNTQYSYDANGNVITSTDGTGLTSQYDYDNLNRLVQTVNPASYHSRFTYNRYDEVIQATDARNLTTRYSYDAFGNRLSVNSPDSGETSYEYDGAGNVVAVTNAKAEPRVMKYDALNRMVSVAYANGKTTLYTYDEGAHGVGHMTGIHMSNGSSSTAFTYDEHGRMIGKEVKIGPKVLESAYSYNGAGQLVGVTYPSGAEVSYQYDNQTGNLSDIKVNGQTLVMRATHQPFGPVNGWITGNGSTLYRSFDAHGRLDQQARLGDYFTCTYDSADKLVGFTDNGQDTSYSYYDDGALLSRDAGPSSESYGVDPNQNRIDDAANGATSSYKIASTSNRIVVTEDGNGRIALSYSATGGLAQNKGLSIGYNEAERMSMAASRTSNAFTSYFYNGLNERTYKIGSTGTGRVLYAYDADQRIIGEYQQARNSATIESSTETIYMPNVADYGSRDGYMPIGVLKDGELYYVACGLQGEPRYIVDSTNKPVWRWRHDAFGRGAPDQRPSGSSKDFVYNNRFPGQTYDAETGFFYNLNRYYDPATGRYTRPDPIGLAGGMNPYAYVGGDPVTNVDPSGLENVNLQRLSILERSGQSGSEIWWKIADIISTIGESVQREASGAIDWCGSALVSSAEIAPSVAAGAPVPVVGTSEVLSLAKGYLEKQQDPDDINRYVNNDVKLMEKREKEHLSRLQYLRDPAP